MRRAIHRYAAREAGVTPRLTSDARRALGAAGLAPAPLPAAARARWSWRSAPRATPASSRSLAAQGINGRSSTALDAWIAITADGRVLAYTGKCELGQGLFTAQVQLVAEELDVPLARVTLTMCDTAVTPDQGTTSGAQSHPANFNHANLALACATAREALVRLASERLASPAASLATATARCSSRRIRRAASPTASSSAAADSCSRSTRPRRASARPTGKCSARPCRGSTSRPW